MVQFLLSDKMSPLTLMQVTYDIQSTWSLSDLCSGFQRWPIVTHQNQSKSIKTNHDPSKPITTHQNPSRPIKANHDPSKPITTHQSQSRPIKTNHDPSKPITTHHEVELYDRKKWLPRNQHTSPRFFLSLLWIVSDRLSQHIFNPILIRAMLTGKKKMSYRHTRA